MDDRDARVVLVEEDDELNSLMSRFLGARHGGEGEIVVVLRRNRAPRAALRLEISGIAIDGASRRVTRGGAPIELTSVEYDILETLMRAAGEVVSRDDLMARLYQRPATAFDRALDVHISHLRRKLEYDVIRTVRGVGYQFTVEERPPRRRERPAT